MEDGAQIQAAMAELQRSATEFPIKVEGTHTLPYTSHLQHLDLEAGELHLKLIRPLPHEMTAGAPFEMTFAVGEQRLVAPMTFLGRKSYLLYRFTIPERMLQCDRRKDKRYPFRPRENAYVLAQDSAIPGHGLAGPLFNLSLGGLAFRVDRILRLDDHLGIQPTVGFFERGKELPILKIRDLPKLPLFEARGIIANAWERGGEIIVGVQFGSLREAELQQIQAVIDLRELIQRTPRTGQGSTLGTMGADTGGRSQASEPLSRRVNPAGVETPDALTRLGRRCTPLFLAMTPGAPREEVVASLAAAGYQRIQLEDSLSSALSHLRQGPDCLNPLLIWDQGSPVEGGLESLVAHQRELRDDRELPVALIQQEGELPAFEDPLLRPMAWPSSDPRQWLPVLDDLAGL